ncbi:MAG: phosphopantetheine-binding protein [Microcoleus sp.]
METALTKKSLTSYLVNKVAEELDMAPAQVDTNELLSRYGLTSMQAVSLSGDLEKFLGHKINPTIFWEHPSINALVNTLTKTTEDLN